MPFSSLFVSNIRITDDLPANAYYSRLPIIRSLQGDGLELTKPVTVFVGENGIGKSTLIEAIAVSLGFNPEGGTKNYSFSTADTHSDLYNYISVSKGINSPRDGYFFRAESFYNAASYIDNLDPNLICSYGGRSLHAQSHGESFISLVENRFGGNGIYILDEPEAALSPMRLLRLMANMSELVKANSQFIISTHSPILMAYPDAEVVNLTEHGFEIIPYYETEHFQLTKQFVNNPSRIFKYLFDDDI